MFKIVKTLINLAINALKNMVLGMGAPYDGQLRAVEALLKAQQRQACWKCVGPT
jgi:hypothetical protein